MLHWQRLNFLDVLKRNCCNRFFIVSLILHLLCCFALFFIYQDYHQRLAVSVHKSLSSAAIVKVLPLSAPRSMLKNRTIGSKKNDSKKSGVIAQKKSKSIKKAKNLLKKLVPQSSKKKLSKKEIKKQNLQQESQKEQSVEKETVEKKSMVPEPIVPEPITIDEKQEIVFVTQQEFDALQLQKKLQESLFDLWTPPTGIPAQAVCEVLVTIGWDGTVLEKEITKKTGILIYDLSVQEALDGAAFPKEVWGKKITISFKP